MVSLHVCVYFSDTESSNRITSIYFLQPWEIKIRKRNEVIMSGFKMTSACIVCSLEYANM